MYAKDKKVTKQVAPYRRMYLHISPDRNGAAVYFTQTLDLTKTLAWIDRQREETGKRLTLLHVFMAAAGRLLHANPNLNRYVAGYHMYQRDGVQLTVSVKKAMTADAKVVLLKVPMEADDDPIGVHDRVTAMVSTGRSEKTAAEKEYDLLLLVPGFLMGVFVRFAMWLHRRHWLPGVLVDPDGMFCSLFVANLGSVGLDSAYHHLYEWGNCPFFATVGRVQDRVVPMEGGTEVRKIVEVKYAFDERIEDGMTCAIALEGLQALIEDPERFFSASSAPRLVAERAA